MITSVTLSMALLIAALLAPYQSYAEAGDECVILLHGLGRTSYSMNKLEAALSGLSYRVWNKTYPSTSASIESLAPGAIEPALDFLRTG